MSFLFANNYNYILSSSLSSDVFISSISSSIGCSSFKLTLLSLLCAAKRCLSYFLLSIAVEAGLLTIPSSHSLTTTGFGSLSCSSCLFLLAYFLLRSADEIGLSAYAGSSRRPVTIGDAFEPINDRF